MAKMALQDEDDKVEPIPWHLGIYDAHCHPTDTMATVEQMPSMSATAFVIMATRAEDQELVDQVASRHGLLQQSDPRVNTHPSEDSRCIVPSFGWHPWFSHKLYDDRSNQTHTASDVSHKIAHYQQVLIPSTNDQEFLSELPDPFPLSAFLAQTRRHLEQHSLAMIGEVGLDKSFRLPTAWLPAQQATRDKTLTPGGREGRELSPYRVQLKHQQAILTAQLRLAGEMQRAVSVHGVQAHGALYDTISSLWKGHERTTISKRQRRRTQGTDNRNLDHYQDDANDHHSENYTRRSREFPPRLCLHSYSGPAEFVTQYIQPHVPIDVYFSFSIVINFSSSASGKTEEAIKAIPHDRILVESDMHTAGATMDNNLEDMVRKICRIKEWTLTHGVAELKSNWVRFVYG